MREEVALRQRLELEAEWTCAGVEPGLASVMDDPIVQQLMQSSGLTADEFGCVVNEARRAVQNRVGCVGIGKSKMRKRVG